MPGLFMIYFFLFVAAVGMCVGLLGRQFSIRAGGLLVTCACLLIVAGILYVTQWSRTPVYLY